MKKIIYFGTIVFIALFVLKPINANPLSFNEIEQEDPKMHEESPKKINTRALPSKIKPTSSISKKSVKIGDQVTYSIGDISFEDGLIYELGIDTLFGYKDSTDAFDTTSDVTSITIPRFEAVVNNQITGVQVNLFRVNGDAGSIKRFKFQIGDGILSYTITKEELLSLTSSHDMNRLYFIISPIKADGNSFPINTPFTKLEQFGTIDLNYTVIPDGKPYLDRSYQLHQSRVRARYVANIGSSYFEEIIIGSNPSFITSDFSISASKSKGLKVGDEIDLTFTVDNQSNYLNRALWVGFKYEGLTLLPGSAVVKSPDNSWGSLDNTNWTLENGSFNIPLYSTTWFNIKSKNTYTITQRFKIDDDFKGTKINLSPYIFYNNNYKEASFNNLEILLLGYNVKSEYLDVSTNQSIKDSNTTNIVTNEDYQTNAPSIDKYEIVGYRIDEQPIINNQSVLISNIEKDHVIKYYYQLIKDEVVVNKPTTSNKTNIIETGNGTGSLILLMTSLMSISCFSYYYTTHKRTFR